MRGKRSKQYRKLMQQYGMSFGFHEPYQVLLDAETIRDADRIKMNLVSGLERTLHGQVKPLVTQCCMRHLYAAKNEPGISALIDKVKLFERRLCGHRPEEYPQPLNTKDCLASVVDPKDKKTNKHRYVVASQDSVAREAMRGIPGTPLIYIFKSVMIMESMAVATVENREREERGKLKAGLKRGTGTLKRKRDQENGEEGDRQAEKDDRSMSKKKKVKGPKGPNPLSVKKSKKGLDEGHATPLSRPKHERAPSMISSGPGVAADLDPAKRKRKRKHGSGTGSGFPAEADVVDGKE